MCFSGGNDGVRLMVGLIYLEGLLQPKQLYNSMITAQLTSALYHQFAIYEANVRSSSRKIIQPSGMNTHLLEMTRTVV